MLKTILEFIMSKRFTVEEREKLAELTGRRVQKFLIFENPKVVFVLLFHFWHQFREIDLHIDQY